MGSKKSRKNEMTFLEHLEALRWHLIRAFAAIVLFAVLAFIFKDVIFDHVLIAPKTPDFFTNHNLCKFGNFVGVESLCINSEPFQLINIQMSGQFTTHIMVSLVVGLIFGFPYLFFEFWNFVRPALYEKESRHAKGAVFFSSVLFIAGVVFGYFVIVPLSVHFLGTYQVSGEVINQINLRSYISTVTSVVLATGVIFELPVLVYFFTKAGLVTPGFLKKYRRHSLVIILALSAIITPPDIFSQILVAFPLLILYEAGIMISKKIVRKQEKLAG